MRFFTSPVSPGAERRGPGGGGGTWLADGWGSAARFSERYPLLITETCGHTHFYDEIWRKTTHFLLFFVNFWITHPCLRKICRKRDPCLENLGPKNPPIWRHIPVPSTCYVPPPPGVTRCRGRDPVNSFFSPIKMNLPVRINKWFQFISPYRWCFVYLESCTSPRGDPTRLMTMSPLYLCGRPCSRGTHHETVNNLALFSSIINGITKESRLRISIPWECFQFFNRIENSITFTR